MKDVKGAMICIQDSSLSTFTTTTNYKNIFASSYSSYVGKENLFWGILTGDGTVEFSLLHAAFSPTDVTSQCMLYVKDEGTTISDQLSAIVKYGWDENPCVNISQGIGIAEGANITTYTISLLVGTHSAENEGMTLSGSKSVSVTKKENADGTVKKKVEGNLNNEALITTNQPSQN